MAKPKRAVFVINSLDAGGAQRIMCTLLRHSDAERAEFDMTLVVLDDEPAVNAPPDWVKVRQLDCKLSARRAVFFVRRVFAELRPDVTLSFLTRSNLANVVNAGSAACVISERAYPSEHFKRGAQGVVMRTVVRAAYPRADRVIVPSDGVGDDLRENFNVAASKLISIPNPVDVEAIAALSSEPLAAPVEGSYILAAGRLVKMKGFDALIRAYAASGITQKLVIAGEGPDRDMLTSLAHECGVAGRVTLPGFAENPYPWMRGADFFVLSSHSEGFPNAMVEAMALGTPVVATNCPSGPAQILAEAPRSTITGVTRARHGMLAPVGDVEGMAQALRAMAEPGIRKTYGERAAARARDFCAEAAKDAYWRVMRETLAARQL
jgi:N-acetylgalactosamine-N,N'-diacetylbacillosaminyl-diphospho-undecaprenol 4-alpha-N-acetylgalactosaminyltransferase